MCNQSAFAIKRRHLSLGRKIAVMFAFLCAFLTGNASSQTTYVIGVEDVKYFPHYDHERNEYKGYARAILDAFAKAEGIRFEYRIIPVNRLYREFLDGNVDFKYPDNPVWAQSLKEGLDVSYSVPLAGYIDGTMVLKEHLGKGAGRLQTVGTIRGFTPWDYFDRIQAGTLSVSENREVDRLLAQVLRGRIDGAYLNVDVARYYLEKVLRKPGELVFDDALPHTRDGYHLSTFKHPEITRRMTQFIRDNQNVVRALQTEHNLSPDF